MIDWVKLNCDGIDSYSSTYRAKVPGGWLVRVSSGSGDTIAFYPDPNHTWDGNSLD
jgi:hypothetical protein